MFCKIGSLSSLLSSSELHMEKKLHLQKQISVPLNTLMSCRLREGYGIREIFFKGLIRYSGIL